MPNPKDSNRYKKSLRNLAELNESRRDEIVVTTIGNDKHKPRRGGIIINDDKGNALVANEMWKAIKGL